MVKISSIFVAFLENMNFMINTVKLGNKERFVKELIGIKEPFAIYFIWVRDILH